MKLLSQHIAMGFPRKRSMLNGLSVKNRKPDSLAYKYPQGCVRSLTPWATANGDTERTEILTVLVEEFLLGPQPLNCPRGQT